MANGRLSSVETFWLMVGLRRFQSNVAIRMITTTINNKKVHVIAVTILPVLLMLGVPHFCFACPKDSPVSGNVRNSPGLKRQNDLVEKIKWDRTREEIALRCKGWRVLHVAPLLKRF